jgi:hypothetical protein
MKDKLKRIDINIPNDWLQSGYFVYVAKINYRKKTFLYVGQTGDNNHPTARGPLYRISGHISKTASSDENQIIKGLRRELKIKDDDHVMLEKVLGEMDFSYSFWKISDFNYADTDDTKTNKRKQTQLIEHNVIWHLQNQFTLFNGEVKTEVSDGNRKYFSKEEIDKLLAIANDIRKGVGDE